jgi:hypothetical protein
MAGAAARRAYLLLGVTIFLIGRKDNYIFLVLYMRSMGVLGSLVTSCPCGSQEQKRKMHKKLQQITNNMIDSYTFRT